MILQSSLSGMLWDSMPTLYFDEDSPKSVQILFTAFLGASVGAVLSYIVSELHRIIFKD